MYIVSEFFYGQRIHIIFLNIFDDSIYHTDFKKRMLGSAFLEICDEKMYKLLHQFFLHDARMICLIMEHGKYTTQIAGSIL